MARHFDIPVFYRGGVISRLKRGRQEADPRKHDLSPTVLDFGPVRFVIARHFGFCFGVENAVEIAYQTLAAHPDKRIFLLSEIIHNPRVNTDLQERGICFICDPSGKQLVPWEDLHPDDVVIVPAFGTTLEMQAKLAERGIDPYEYDTTCPFVEKVWKRSHQLGERDFSVVVHGKATHEETRATFSHSASVTPTVVVFDIEEARILADVIAGRRGAADFQHYFGHKCSPDFDPVRDLERIGVVNQTTMLASETREIAQLMRGALVERYGEGEIARHFADTSDTLCYATNENQNATYALIEHGANLAIVVGGYNSSNTSHIVELCENAMPTYFISSAEDVLSADEIRHFVLESREVRATSGWLPGVRPLDVILTCGASCPDAILDGVLMRVLSLFDGTTPVDDVLSSLPR